MTTSRVNLEVALLENQKGRANFLIENVRNDSKYIYQFVHARDVEHLFSILSSRDCDLAIIDCQKPQSNFNVIHKIKTEFPEVPMLTICPQKFEDDAASSLDYGAQDYVLSDHSTPVTIQKTLWMALGRRRFKELETFAKQIRNTEESFRLVVHHCMDGIVILNRENVVKLINPSAEYFLGVRASEFINAKCSFFLGRTPPFEMQTISNSAKQIHLHVLTIPLLWSGEDSTMYMLRDISDRIQFEKQKDDFLNTVSHELRNPLSIIKEGVSQVVEGLHGSLADKQKRFLDMSLNAAGQLSKIVDDLLDLAKLEDETVRLDLVHIDLKKIMQNICDSFSLVAHKKGLKLTFLQMDNIEQIYADPDRVVQVLNNLVGNAIKFTQKGTIELSIQDFDDRLECWVRDTGRGMTPTELGRLFSKFEQFGAAKESSVKGTGLGLVISKNIMAMHGGDIAAESQINVGTTFKAIFPKTPIHELFIREIESEIYRCAKNKDFFTAVCWTENFKKSVHFNGKPENVLRGSFDKIFHDESKIYLLLPSTPKLGAKALIERIKSITYGGAEPVDGFRFVTFPGDATSAQEIFDAVNNT